MPAERNGRRTLFAGAGCRRCTAIQVLRGSACRSRRRTISFGAAVLYAAAFTAHAVRSNTQCALSRRACVCEALATRAAQAHRVVRHPARRARARAARAAPIEELTFCTKIAGAAAAGRAVAHSARIAAAASATRAMRTATRHTPAQASRGAARQVLTVAAASNFTK